MLVPGLAGDRLAQEVEAAQLAVVGAAAYRAVRAGGGDDAHGAGAGVGSPAAPVVLRRAQDLPDAGHVLQERPQRRGRGAEDGEPQLYVGPEEQVVVQALLLRLGRVRQLDDDDQLDDGGGARAVSVDRGGRERERDPRLVRAVVPSYIIRSFFSYGAGKEKKKKKKKRKEREKTKVGGGADWG